VVGKGRALAVSLGFGLLIARLGVGTRCPLHHPSTVHTLSALPPYPNPSHPSPKVFAILSVNLSMLCALEWAMPVLFGAVSAYLGLFWWLFAVDTQRVALQEIPELWQHHWFWRRVVGASGGGANDGLGSLPPPPAAAEKGGGGS